MNRRTVLKALGAAPILLSGFSGKSFASAGRTPSWPERLYLVNPCSGQRFEMVSKGYAPIRSVLEIDSAMGCVLEYDRAANSRAFEYMVRCLHATDAVALTGILLDGSPGTRIRVMVDGEPILKDMDPARISAAEIKPMYSPSDIFTAETPGKVKVGIFLPNGTQVVVASERGPVPARVRLETTLYTLKDPKPSGGR